MYKCHLVLSVPGILATIMASLLHCFLSVVTSLSFASFIPVTSCISSIHLLLGRPLLLLSSPHASIIPFSNPSDRIICPKNPSFLLIAVCCSVSFFFYSNLQPYTFVSIFLCPCYSLRLPPYPHLTYIDFFSIFFVIVHISQPYKTVRKISDPTILFFVSMLMCLSRHIFSSPIIVAFPVATLLFISSSHLPSFSTSDPRNVKLVTTSISSPSILKLSHSMY